MYDSAYGVMNARKARILAAKVMGANAFQIFRDVLIFESLPQTFVGLRNGISTDSAIGSSRANRFSTSPTCTHRSWSRACSATRSI